MLQFAVDERIQGLAQAQLEAVGNKVADSGAHRRPPRGSNDDMHVGRGTIDDDLSDLLRYVFKLGVGGTDVVPAINDKEGCALFWAADKPSYFIDDAPHLFGLLASCDSGDVGQAL